MPTLTQLNEAELEEHFSHASGPGGQNVNKVATRVTLRHVPSGLAVSVDSSRSQARNRQLARERLLAALNEREARARAAARHEQEKARRRKRDRPRAVKRQFVEGKRRRARVKEGRGSQSWNDT
ncbi:MAG TPA: peptide chain release factor-like protein [Methylomirabilota bacterium]|nr:peptide chain release factor-like protein [Methylomirabilota bacterium]